MNKLFELRAQLENANAPYVMLEPLQAERARFRFIGLFQEREVIWDAELALLKNTDQKSQSIEVGENIDGEISVKVVLALSCITEPDILKTVIMIQNYKRLCHGKHEWSTP